MGVLGGVGGGAGLDVLGSVGSCGGWLSVLGGRGGLISSISGSSGSNLVLLGGRCGHSSERVAGNSVNLNFSSCHRVDINYLNG